MSRRPGPAPAPLFLPPEIGLAIDRWEDLPEPTRPKCSECDRPLRSRESQEAEIGPCCAAKIGRAIATKRKAHRAAARRARAQAASTPGATA